MAEARRERETRPPDVAALGEDLNDAVVGARSVERRGRGTANDLDALDVGRIEVGETILRIRPDAEVGELRRPVVDDDAVDDVERIGAGDERVDAAQTHGDAAAARAAGVLRDLRAGNLALHRLIDGDRLRATDHGRVDRRRCSCRSCASRSAVPVPVTTTSLRLTALTLSAMSDGVGAVASRRRFASPAGTRGGAR